MNLLAQGKWQAAVTSFREALRLDPGNAPARANLERAQAGPQPEPVAP